MIKKNFFLILIFIIITIFQINIVFGGCEQCLIQDGPAPILDTYFDNLSVLSNNLSDQIAGIEPDTGVTKEFSKIKRDIQRSFNQIINWDGYFSYFDFYVIYGTTNEYVFEIWRDYNLLLKKDKLLNKFLTKIIKRGYGESEININELCSGVENCNFGSKKLFDIVGEIIKNHESVKDYYRLSIVGKRNNFGKKSDFGKNIIFVPKNFKEEFYEYYNEYTTSNCSSCEGNFFDRVKEQIEILSDRHNYASKGIKEWQDAIAILDGTLEKRQYERLERRLLEKELRKNGLSMRASSNIIKNLKKFNDNGGYSLDNNFVTNSFDYIKNSVESEISDFRDSIIESFRDSSKKYIPTQDFNNIDIDFKTVSKIDQKIAEIYNLELPYSNFEDNTTENLESRMIELHYNLTRAIKNLDSTIKVSQRVCNSQGQGIGKCD